MGVVPTVSVLSKLKLVGERVTLCDWALANSWLCQ